MTKISHDSETLAEGQQVFTAAAFIHKKVNGIDKLFMAKRSNIKKFLPGVFELAGGHIDYGEDIVEGLIREVKEEFDVKVRVGEPFAVFTYKNDIKKCHSIQVIYFCEFAEPEENIKINHEDHSEFKWVAEDEIESIYGNGKDENDQEIQAIKRGFEILRGESLLYS